MYTHERTTVGKLRTYYRDLTERYKKLIRYRRFSEARETYDLRFRVWRALRIAEEFDTSS